MNARPPPVRFAPVPLKARHDGWTPARQARFIEELAATRSITRACAVVGMSRESAYRLRDRERAEGFRLAWDRALRLEVEMPGPRSPRAVQRLRRLGPLAPGAGFRGKVDDVEEMEGPPNPAGHGRSPSSALLTLQTLLERLRGSKSA